MEIANFGDFQEVVKDNILDYLPEKYKEAEIELKEVIKTNQELTGLVIKLPDNNAAPTIYLDEAYKEYQSGVSLEDILENLADIRVTNERELGVDLTTITDYEKAKERIVPEIMNASMNARLLEERPHMIMEDLAVSYLVKLDYNENIGMASVPVNEALMERWGVSKEELHELAVSNIDKIMEPEVVGICELLGNMSGLFDKPPGFDEMLVVKGKSGVKEASAILSPGIDEKIKERIGEYYILPCSIHELIAFPKANGEAKELAKIVAEVNATEVLPCERLSNSVYEFNSQTHLLERADQGLKQEQAHNYMPQCGMEL